MFKLFEHSKYMIMYKIFNSWNFYSFSNCSILKVCYCSKLNNFRNLMFFEMEKFGKFVIFYKIQIFRICHIVIFWSFRNWIFFLIVQIINFWKFPNWVFFNLTNCKFLKIPKLKIFRILQIWSFWNCPNWKIKKFQNFSNLAIL